MALTKLDYLRIAERVEAMYMNCSTQLVLNIVRHLASGKGLSTAEWQIKKLSEMQSLTRESMEIIAANTGKRREAVEQAFREVFGIGLADTEKVLQAAVKAGKLFPVPSVEESEAMRQLLQAYIGQADDALNLVNTVMLDSTLSRYRYYVNQIDMESQKEAARILQKLGTTNEAGLGTNLAYTQNVLNTQSTGVVTGAVARQKAVRDAIKDLASRGITGFVDAGGHHWTPEAYVNMDIRTTAHNVAIEAQKQRSAEYGVSTFQISTHAGARPLCAPYQGWICSWDNGGGTVTDLYGKEYQVHGINETTYGEAAGIFGVNCGHFPETFVDGYSIPRYEELTPEQEKRNEIEYAQSQQQRQIEREIRQAKTEAAAYSAAGDKEAFNKAAAKVKEKQNDYKQFCEQTGRTPRPDRTQVSTYSRSEASKVSWSNRKNTQPPKPPKNVNSQLTQSAANGIQSQYKLSPFTTDYGKKLDSLFASGNDTAKKAWEKFIPNGGCIEDAHFSGVPHHSNGKVWFDIDADAVNPRGVGCTFFHENGHAVDFYAGWISDDDAFYKALKADYESALKATGKKTKDDQRFALSMELSKADIAHKANGVSDICDGLSKGKCKGLYGHGAKYWKDRPDTGVQREAFAHMNEAAFLDGQREMIKKYFPTAYKRFIELLEGAI